MGERQRFQSRFEQDRSRRDYEDDARSRERRPSQDDRPEGGRYSGYYAERQFGTRGVDEQERGSRYGAHDAWNQSQNQNQRHDEQRYNLRDRDADRGYNRDAAYFGGGYGRDQHERSGFEGYEPWGRDRSYPSAYETQSHYRARPSYSTPYASPEYAREYRREHANEGRQSWREDRHDDESIGQQLRETTQRIARTVKRVFRGPKGYKRSDDRIREDVSDRLGESEYLDCSEVEVSVSNGEVTLTGSVLSRQEKFLAEEIADDISGVTDVHNQLRVKRAQGTQANDVTAGSNAQLDALRSRTARG